MKTPARLKGKTQKIISILIVFVFMLAFVNLISCNDVGKEEAIKIEKTDSKKIETLYVGVEYDASNLFVREEGVNYEIEKLFCFNKEFEKIDIPFDGFKFTQTEKRDVSVVIKASKNGLESRRLFELKANRVKETESLDLDSPNRTAADRFEYEFVDNTGCSVFSQTITQKKENVKDGIHAIKCVYGETKNMNNTVGERAEKALEFGEMLKKRTGLEVIMWDERLTTVSADRALMEAGVRRENRKEYLDGIAAVFILQGYLDSLTM